MVRSPKKSQNRSALEEIARSEFWRICGAVNLKGLIYLFVVDEEREEPNVVFFLKEHPIWESIAEQLEVNPSLIKTSPGLLIGHDIDLKPILQEQYFAGEA